MKTTNKDLQTDSDIDIKNINVSGATEVVAEPTILLKDLDSYLKKAIEERMASSATSLKNIEIPKHESIDDLPELANWEIKDRSYIMIDGSCPVSYSIRDRSKKSSNLTYYNKVKNTTHTLRYSQNQPSFLMDKQTGDFIVTYVTIYNGNLLVPKENPVLQKFLHIHPDRNIIWKEFDPSIEIKKQVEEDAKLYQALKLFNEELDDQTLEAICMLMCKDYSEEWPLYTLKRELNLAIKHNPSYFIQLSKDPTLKVKSIAKTALNRGLLKYSDYRFYDEDSKAICDVPRYSDEYEEISKFFLSPEGRSHYDYLKKKLSM